MVINKPLNWFKRYGDRGKAVLKLYNRWNSGKLLWKITLIKPERRSRLCCSVYSCDFLHHLHGFWDLFWVYEGESAFRASPASDSHFMVLIDHTWFSQDFAKDALRAWDSSLRATPFFKIHWYASTDMDLSSISLKAFPCYPQSSVPHEVAYRPNGQPRGPQIVCSLSEWPLERVTI